MLWLMAIAASFSTIALLALRDPIATFFQRFRRKKRVAAPSN
jgi:hypothetical protein